MGVLIQRWERICVGSIIEKYGTMDDIVYNLFTLR